MTLSANTLAVELENLVPSGTEAAAIARLVDAWEIYFGGAAVNGIAAAPGSFGAGLSAMSAALVGMSAPGAGGASLSAGLTAFWTAISPLATSIWIVAPIILVPPVAPPAGIAGLAATLASVFASNTAGQFSLSQSAQQIAAVLHAQAGIGGLVSGSVLPLPPSPLPIL
jgi:hypothetical protein